MPVLHRDLLERLHQLVLPADQVVRQQVLWGQEQHENIFQASESGLYLDSIGSGDPDPG